MGLVVVVGASRGIGLELVRAYRARGEDVLATVRTSSEHLEATGARVVDGIDVTDPPSLQKLKDAVAGTPVAVLVLNAGYLGQASPSDPDAFAASCARSFAINATAPVLVVDALRAALVQGSKVLLLGSRAGSSAMQENAAFGDMLPYRMSKAAAHLAVANLAVQYRERGVAFVSVCPARVATQMTADGFGWEAGMETARGSVMTPAETVPVVMEIVDSTNMENSGAFRGVSFDARDGKRYPVDCVF
ncbi:unnamed protein product [Pedinophyceae sp. YPF-701]|nr:unnamed protein product [Pedinophyceae sp. YPF-701]